MNTHPFPQRLPGWLNIYYRTHNGKKLGPYYVRRWKENGRLYKAYVKPADAEKVRAQCAAHREARTTQRALNKEFRVFKSNWTFYTRILERCQKREVTGDQSDFFKRIHAEGFFIPGRPSLRRKFGWGRGFMVPFITKRKWKEIEADFFYEYNDSLARKHPELAFEAQARDLKRHIFGTIKPRKMKKRLVKRLEREATAKPIPRFAL